MKVKHRFTDELFDAEQMPERKTLQLDSPSGDKVMMDLSAGTWLLTGVDGKKTATPPVVFAAQFEEVPGG